MAEEADPRAAYEQWKFAYELTNRLLQRLEAEASAILEQLRCPSDPVRVFAILNGEAPAPWPARTAKRDRRRAYRAMVTLATVPTIRRHIQFGHENASQAAYWGVVAGLSATDAAVNARLLEGAIRGGQQRAKQQRDVTVDRKADIQRLMRQWADSELLQIQYDTPARYVKHKTGLSLRSVQRYFHDLRSAPTRRKTPRQK